jgi:hypothetical protein
MMRADRSLIATAGAARSQGRFLRNYFDVSGLCDVHALRALCVLNLRDKQHGISGKAPRENPEYSVRPSSHDLVIIINYLTMMFI